MPSGGARVRDRGPGRRSDPSWTASAQPDRQIDPAGARAATGPGPCCAPPGTYVAGDDLGHQLSGTARRRERIFTVKGVMERDAEAELIGSRIDRLATETARAPCRAGVPSSSPVCVSGPDVSADPLPRRSRHGRPRSQHPIRRASPKSITRTRPSVADDHVLRLEVAMHEARGVGRGQPARRLRRTTASDLAPACAAAPRSQVRERLALDELHRDEDLSPKRADVVDRDHVRMGEPRHRLRLASRRARAVVAARPRARAGA